MNKKIIYIILLIVILGGIIAFLVNQDKIEYASDTNTNTPEIASRSTEEEKEMASNNQTDNNNESQETIITELEDGTLYSSSLPILSLRLFILVSIALIDFSISLIFSSILLFLLYDIILTINFFS